MKINIVQLNLKTGDIAGNLEKVKQALETPQSRESLLSVFPANTLCGYPLYSSVVYNDLQKEAQVALQACVDISEHRAFIIGMPLHMQDRGLCNALIFVQNRAIRAVVTKKYLNLDEQKYYVRGEGVQVVQYQNQKIAIGFYEDIKELSKSHTEDIDIVVCCGCNVFDYNKPYRTRYKMQKIVETMNTSLVYVNRIGGEGSYLFAGGSMAINAAGNVLVQLPYFEEDNAGVDLQIIQNINDEKPEVVELVHKALITGIRDYFAKNGFKKAVLGLSGGIDSALVAALATQALGSENVHGVLMPSEYSSDHSITDAVALAKNLGITYDIVPISDVFHSLKTAMKPVFAGLPEDVTEENMQARIRGTILMAISNKTGAVLLNTSNKSEAAVGYGTLYGDMCGALAVIADLYKNEVYELSNYINRDGEIIPQNTIDKAPSAELRPGQKDSDSLPDYDELDAILSMHLECEMDFEQICAEDHDPDTVRRVLKLVKNNEYKRCQVAPILKVSPMTFGIDRKVPIS
ncbi:MAG: NAD+ synthase [Bacteroidales bacterium]|jgi:NAD+ synthase (glutamine-hydrolysing)|nr:NAD+ synthase [Bacteroidales bacterium]